MKEDTMWSRASHTIRRISKTWAELDYAQRRLLEIQTGIPMTPERERTHARVESHELEVLFAREHPEASGVCAGAPGPGVSSERLAYLVRPKGVAPQSLEGVAPRDLRGVVPKA